MVPGLVDEASRLNEELSKRMEEQDRLTMENNIVLALETEISESKTTTGFIVGSIEEVNAHAIETERDV